MRGQDALAFRRNNDQRETMRRRGCVVHHGQSIVGAHRERVGQRHDLLTRILALCHDRVGALGEEDVGTAFGEVPSIHAAPCGWLRARGRAGQLQSLALKQGAAAGCERLGFRKDLERIVA